MRYELTTIVDVGRYTERYKRNKDCFELVKVNEKDRVGCSREIINIPEPITKEYAKQYITQEFADREILCFEADFRGQVDNMERLGELYFSDDGKIIIWNKKHDSNKVIMYIFREINEDIE